MINKSDRQEDIITILKNMDISPTMFKNAMVKYNALSSYLEDYGIIAKIYPQGSFAIGTVIRPNNYGRDAYYDLDIICQIIGKKSEYSPSSLREKVKIALVSNELYKDKLSILNECFSIEYAEINNSGFIIDIVPAIDESEDIKNRLIQGSENSQLINTSIALPKQISKEEYEWITNNPLGFKKWFDEINQQYLESIIYEQKEKLFIENRNLYLSVDDVPEYLVKTPLQRVIQIFKYHRDIYYLQIKNGNEIKPISAILNVIVTDIAKYYNKNCTVFELLEHILSELDIYSNYLFTSDVEFRRKFDNRSVISKSSGKWLVKNPANPEDNLADKWNENEDIPNRFFKWIKVLREDLINSLDSDDEFFYSVLENSFGKNSTSHFAQKYNSKNMVEPEKIKVEAKPYSYYDIK